MSTRCPLSHKTTAALTSLRRPLVGFTIRLMPLYYVPPKTSQPQRDTPMRSFGPESEAALAKCYPFLPDIANQDIKED